ncbi:MAG: PD40 domain-containing protein [Bryobacterales bacterium]|nr:PD40 domain-containing protein [Bryobacterales bacterium]
MLPGRHPVDIVRFGPFEVALKEGVLRKHNLRVRLQAQPFQVLAALLEHPGQTVTREELRSRLWPDDTFVDFEHGLNAAVTRLRQALADSADRPQYIETVAKRGYRFIGEVILPPVVPAEEPRSVSQPKAAGRPEPWWKFALIAAAAVLLGTVVVLWRLVFSRVAEVILRPVPLTAFHGSEVDPALSPDGGYVAFSWNGEKQDNFDVYVAAIGSGTLRRVTTDAANDFSPAWSPDGRTIAFLRQSGDDRAALMLVASTGGPEHRIAETRGDQLRDRLPSQQQLRSEEQLANLAWSPDGHWVAAAHREEEEPHPGIYLFSMTGEKRKLTTSPPDSFGDHTPAFSPDGQTLAFCRLLGYSWSELYLLSLDSKQKPVGNVLRLTNHNQWSTNPVWMQGGREILYVLRQSPNIHMRPRIQLKSAFGRPPSERTIPLEDDVWHVSAGRRLVYSRRRQDSNIWRAKIPARNGPSTLPELFISSTRNDGHPRYSPDGGRISFVSSRSGAEEVWISNAAGSDPIRLTSFNGPLVGPPAWSPDGHWLVFHARPEGQADLFIMPAAGGTPRRLTHHPSDETTPSYSRDGLWIYYSSMRSGRHQLWKMPSAGGESVQVTTNGGLRPLESPDGKMLFYLSEAGNAIRRVPASGGAETHVAAPVCANSGFALTAEGLLYPMPTPSGDRCEFTLLNLATGNARPIVQTVSPRVGMVVGVSRDETNFLFVQDEIPSVDLMLVENFDPRPLR